MLRCGLVLARRGRLLPAVNGVDGVVDRDEVDAKWLVDVGG